MRESAIFFREMRVGGQHSVGKLTAGAAVLRVAAEDAGHFTEMLTEQLRELEGHGLVKRTIYMPRRRRGWRTPPRRWARACARSAEQPRRSRD
jgi:hypothetical protein